MSRAGRRRTRGGALGFVVALVIGLVVACQASGTSGGSGASPTAPTRAAPAPAPTRAAPVPAPGPSALRALASLPVKGRAPMTGYDRALFGPAWSDDTADLWGHNGCDTRNDILRRDLDTITVKPDTGGCVVLTGVLDDPYTGRRIAFTRGVETSTAVEIDHVVALADAWETGAQQWSARRREAYANDPLVLMAVDGPTNMSKGAGDAATWLPPAASFRCAYVARQIAVKKKWGLWVKPAERDAMAGVLGRCPGQRLPAASGAGPPLR